MLNNTTGQDIPNEGLENVWEITVKNSLSQFKNQLGGNYADNPTYQAILALYNQAKGQEERFKKQAEELEYIKIDNKKTIEGLEERTKVIINDINKKIGFWEYFLVGTLIVIGISFITLTIDTFWRRNDDYNKMNLEYNDRVNDLENKINILELEKGNLEKKTDEQKVIIENFKKQQNCLKGKKYWEYEQCFK
ncbi:MAG: hypothetical protein V1732_02740 [Patescibacteria group bacterium]|nr:hypothetical protein [Patescibacteria group bacterium]